MVCRSRTKTLWRLEASGRPLDRRFTETTFPLKTILSLNGCGAQGQSSLVRPTLQNSARDHRRSTRFSVQRIIPTTCRRHAADPLVARLSRYKSFAAAVAESGQTLEPGRLYIAPADYHLLVAKGEFNLSVDDLVRYSRPSIDVLFESAADAYGPRLIGVVLTGANDDGAEGAKRIKSRGGLVVVQDPETAEAPVMPRAVIATGAVDQILRLEEIAPFLVERCRLAMLA